MQINVTVLCLQFADGMTHGGLVKDKQSITVIHRLLKTNKFESKMLQKTPPPKNVSSVVTLQHPFSFDISVQLLEHAFINIATVCLPSCHLRWATFDSEEHMQLCPSTE